MGRDWTTGAPLEASAVETEPWLPPRFRRWRQPASALAVGPRMWPVSAVGHAAIELDGVSAGYGGQEVLTRLSLRVEIGQLCAVLGPNGAGKSTVGKVLSGGLRPSAGRARIVGHDIKFLDRRAIAQKVAVVPQNAEVALGFAVREVVAMGRAPHQGLWMHATASDTEAVDRALRVCELDELASRPVSALSGGEQKRVAIARALAQETAVLVLDEANAHLDVRHSIRVHELIRAELSRRPMACLAVLHDLNAAARYADQVVLLKNGRIVAKGAVPEVMTYRRLSELFDVEMYVGVNELDGARYFLPYRPQPPR